MILRSTAESKMDACVDTKEAAWAVYEKELEAREDRKYGEELERRHKRQAVPTVVSEGKSGTTDDSDAASTASTASPARDAFCQALAATPFLCGPRDELFFHGRGYDGPASSTDVPNTTWQSRKPPRDDHDAPDWLKASEFADTKTVNAHKCRQLAELLRMSKKTVLYTGAGISASVIGQAARSGQNKQGWMSDVRLLCLTHPSAGMLAAPTIHNLSTATRCFVSTLPSAASYVLVLRVVCLQRSAPHAFAHSPPAPSLALPSLPLHSPTAGGRPSHAHPPRPGTARTGGFDPLVGTAEPRRIAAEGGVPARAHQRDPRFVVRAG